MGLRQGILAQFTEEEAEQIVEILLTNDDQPGFDIYSAVAAFETEE